MFPLARRVCPAQDGRTTSMEFPVMSPSLGPSAPGCPPVHWQRHRSHGAHVCGLVQVRRSKQPAAYARKVLLNRHLLERPSPDGPSRQGEPCHRSWNRTLVPSSGEDLRPWWPTARYLPRSTRTSSPPRNSQWPRRRLLLPIFIRQGWPQAMSHLPGRALAKRIRAVTSDQRRLVEVGPYLAVRRRSRSDPPSRQCLPSSCHGARLPAMG
jgi:hypothetical protein